MKKIVKEESKNTPELWFNWLTRKLNSHEAFKTLLQVKILKM